MDEASLRKAFDEMKTVVTKAHNNSCDQFPVPKLKSIILNLISIEGNCEQLKTTLQEYMQHFDIVFYTWRILTDILQKKESKDIDDVFIINCLVVLECIAVPKSAKYINKKRPNGSTIQFIEAGTNFYKWKNGRKFEVSVDAFRKYVNKVWNVINKWNYSKKPLKYLLIVLIDVFFPHIKDRLKTTDLLINSINYGGSLGVLGLQGFLYLHQTENLQYQAIYQKLYSFLNVNMFNTDYKARLFRLSDLFLSSTHLQYNLVAAFTKRLSRLTLKAPPHDIKLICLFITNLLIRHPQLTVLINNKSNLTMDSDPYLENIDNPLESKAEQSSLWEIESLKSHILPNVSLAAQFISEKLPNVECDLNPYLNKNYDEIFKNELKRKQKEPILSHKKLKSSQDFDNEHITKFWSIQKSVVSN